MFPSINITSDLDQVAGWAKGLAAEQLPFAMALALTLTGKDAKAEVEREMSRRFERPTPFTLRGIRLYPANKVTLKASVLWREDARNWLAPQVEGGERKPKALEKALRAAGHLPPGWFVVPGQGARIDQYGNMDRGQVVQVLSQMRITMTAGHDRNMSFNTRKAINAQRKAGGRFFAIPPGSNVEPGVYQRELVGRNITPVMIFVNGARYRTRLPMQDIVARVEADRFESNFRTAMQRAMATAR